MQISEHKDIIELRAEDKKETELLRRIFNGEGPFRYRMNSFGYGKRMRGERLQQWATRLVLTFRLNVQPKSKPNGQPFAKCLKCGNLEFHDTEHARKSGVWCPHVSFVFTSGAYYLEKGKLKDIRFLNNPNFV